MWLNYRRKSTEGCSAYSPILAVIGGTFSVLQMFLLAYNYGTIIIRVLVHVIESVIPPILNLALMIIYANKVDT